MPLSKRSKKVSLTNTKKKGLEHKHKLIDNVRNCVSQYKNIYVFSYHSIRNIKMKKLMEDWKGKGKFFLGKNRVMAVALGRTPNEEVAENINLLSRKLVGSRGLFFTNEPKEEVLKFFDSHKEKEFARTGNLATETVELPEGPLEQFSHSLEPHLRKLGLPTALQRGIIVLLKPHVVCTEGEVLKSEQSSLLKLFEYKMTEFKLTMEFLWTTDGSFEDFGRAEQDFPERKTSKRPNKRNSKKESNGKDEESNGKDEESNGKDEESNGKDEESNGKDEESNGKDEEANGKDESNEEDEEMTCDQDE